MFDPYSLTLHTNHLLERVDHFHQVTLRQHHGVDVLVGHRDLVNHLRVLTAFHAFGGLDLVVHREQLFGLRTAHGAAGPVAAAHEAVRVPLAAHDETPGAHAAGNDPELSRPGAHGALAGHKHLLPKVRFLLHIVVVAVHRLQVRLKRLADHLAQRTYGRLHHHLALQARELLRPAHAAHIVAEVLRTFFEVSQVLVGQVALVQFRVLLGEFNEVGANGI